MKTTTSECLSRKILALLCAVIIPAILATPAMGQTPQALPYSYTSGRTNMTSSNGWSYTGIGTDYSDATTPIKFDTAADVATLSITSSPNQVSFYLKGNSFSGGTFTLLESADGAAFTTVKSYSNNIAGTNTLFAEALSSTTRFIRWLYTTKVTGNVGMGTINVTALSGPSITSFSPTSGQVGDTITINGSGFGAAPAVFFNGVAAASSVNPIGTQITATVPSGATTGKITVEVVGQTTATSATNFTVVELGTPVITLSTSAIAGLNGTTGSPSAATNYTVIGTNLGTTDVSVTPDSALLQVGTNGTDFTNSLNLTPAGGVVSNTIYLRVAATNVVTNYSATISHISGSASNSLAVTGAITNLPPSLVANPTNITGLNAATTNAPSDAQTFTVTGLNLTNDVTISAPAGFEVANDGTNWASSTSLPQTSGSASGTISVRLAASSAFGPRSGSVTNVSGALTNRVTVSGAVPGPDVAGQVYWNFDTATPTSGTSGDYASWTFPAITQNNNNGTTTLLTTTSASFGYTNPFNVLASGTTNAGASARTGAFNAATNAFFEVQIVVPSNTTTGITNISFGSRSTGTGPAAYSIRSSIDNFAADIVTNAMTTNSTWTMYAAPVAIALSNGTNTIRIYGYGSASASATAGTANWRIDDLTLALAAGVVPPAPSSLSYTPSTTNAVVGSAIGTLTPTVTGVVTNYAADPALPAGLSINPTNGVISGTPTAASASTAYTITASNAGGSATADVTIVVSKGTPNIITAPTASAITYGQTLADSLLSDGSASVSGSFAFTTPSTAPNAGTASQEVTFTPTDTANYNTTTTSVSVTVNKATSSITTLPNASGLVEGQTLASSSLTGGVASVSGSFAWTDSSITPPVGTTSYGVTFTATDGANYNTAATSASVTVLSAYQAGYGNWLTNYPSLTGANTNGTADPDNDGFLNNSEYSFGTDPTVPTGALLSTTTSNSVFRTAWAGPATGVTYGVQFSTNLSTMAFSNDPTITIESVGGVMSFTNQATGNKFFRVRATSN